MIVLWILLSSIQFQFYYFHYTIFYKSTPIYILIQLCLTTSFCLSVAYTFIRQIAYDKKWNDATIIIMSFYLKSLLTVFIGIIIAYIFNLRIRYYLLTLAIFPLFLFLYGALKNKTIIKLNLSELL